ncbi:MAG: glycosyltransferase [Deltaproteobacteria bacterium]|nr:glycosyltransferase [Deltaproteobacteria bacterium]
MSRLTVVRLLPVLDFGGVESRVVMTAERIDRSRFDFRVVAFHRPGAAAERIAAAGIPVEILGTDPAVRNPRATVRLARFLRGLRPDVLHASIAEANFHAAIAGTLARVPLRIGEEVGVPVRSARGRRLQRLAARGLHQLVGVTQATVDWLADEQGVPRDQLVRIYNCGKPQFFGPVTRRERTGRFRILTTGRLVWQKDYANLVKAAARAFREGLDGELWIAGEGDLRPDIEAAIAASGLPDRIRLLGYRDDVRALLDDADLFVLPSVSEGCSVALIEAMASGIPCLASDIPGNAEVMDGLAGALVPVSDEAAWARAMRRMADRPFGQRAALGLEGRVVAQGRFSPEIYVAAVEALYDGWSRAAGDASGADGGGGDAATAEGRSTAGRWTVRSASSWNRSSAARSSTSRAPPARRPTSTTSMRFASATPRSWQRSAAASSRASP